ncbi:MAG: hypothetical protein ACOYJB_06730 [Christensenellaceae bacterium]|jgi:hypothetical protein
MKKVIVLLLMPLLLFSLTACNPAPLFEWLGNLDTPSESAAAETYAESKLSAAYAGLYDKLGEFRLPPFEPYEAAASSNIAYASLDPFSVVHDGAFFTPELLTNEYYGFYPEEDDRAALNYYFCDVPPFPGTEYGYATATFTDDDLAFFGYTYTRYDSAPQTMVDAFSFAQNIMVDMLGNYDNSHISDVEYMDEETYDFDAQDIIYDANPDSARSAHVTYNRIWNLSDAAVSLYLNLGHDSSYYTLELNYFPNSDAYTAQPETANPSELEEMLGFHLIEQGLTPSISGLDLENSTNIESTRHDGRAAYSMPMQILGQQGELYISVEDYEGFRTIEYNYVLHTEANNDSRNDVHDNFYRMYEYAYDFFGFDSYQHAARYNLSGDTDNYYSFSPEDVLDALTDPEYGYYYSFEFDFHDNTPQTNYASTWITLDIEEYGNCTLIYTYQEETEI